jgi:hypothetical protein
MEKTIAPNAQVADAREKLLCQTQAAGIPQFSYQASQCKPCLKLTVESEETDKNYLSPMLISGGDPYDSTLTSTLEAAGLSFNEDEEWWELKPVTIEDAVALASKLGLPLFCGNLKP